MLVSLLTFLASNELGLDPALSVIVAALAGPAARALDKSDSAYGIGSDCSMTPGEWAGFGAGRYRSAIRRASRITFLVKGWLNELRPNGGLSMKDQLTRLEKRVDDLFIAN